MNIHRDLLRSLTGDDSELVLQFFVTFSRFEYALKRAGFLENRGYASPDWDSFAKEIEPKLASIQDAEFTNAQTYLLQHPPKKQIVKMPGNKLDWEEEDSSRVPKNATYLLQMVRRVRNNLFHGGKYPERPVSGRRLRNSELLHACMTILEKCLPLDEKVKHFFEELYDE